MSWSERRHILALLAAAALVGCGFTPAYGPNGAAVELLDRVTVDAPSDKDGFDLVERLEERLGRTRSPEFQLGYGIDTRTVEQSVAPDNAINRYQVIGSASFTLRNAETNETVSSGRVTSFTSYSAFGTPVSTEAAEADARTRLMRILADQIVTQLIATSGNGKRP
ncbi:LPS assembly lipoprotein LptE [Defluviimonas salinarum]|uniref:LPS assembly lipoprotein LptE n=1 Tax=Defluviimonas salinarum TaxID=2992147 RepID=A0ABT3J311_9RHOB|nr:LPS assembly lipoprotein LptE [Defluviimonas salinarum]MCW3782070.1 LPS assembly lipoprotein LptE [Defluviimonas salinarum]